jgi:hypothetical protein
LKTGKQAIIEQFLADGIRYMFGNTGTVEIGVVAEPKLTLQKLIALCESSITPETANQAANRTEILVQDRKRAIDFRQPQTGNERS